MNTGSSLKQLTLALKASIDKRPRIAAVLLIIMFTTIFLVEFAEVFSFAYLNFFPRLTIVVSHLFLLAVLSHYINVYLNYRSQTKKLSTLTDQLLAEIKEREQAAEKLRKYEYICSATTDLMAMIDRDYVCQALNDACLVMFKKKRQELLGHSLAEILSPKVFAEKAKGHLERCFNGDTVKYQEWLDFAGMGRKYLEVACHPFYLDGTTVAAVIVVARDITEQKHIEDARRESEDKFRAIFNSSHDGILLADTETRRFLLGNQRICQMLGYSLEELQQLAIEDIHPREDIPYIAEQFKKLFNGGISLVYEARVKRKDNEIIYVDIGASNVSIQGQRYSLGMFRDVSARKHTEAALVESEARLRAFGNALPDIAFILDEHGRYIEVLAQPQKEGLLYAETLALKGRLLHEVLPGPDADLFLGVIRRTLETQENQTIEYVFEVQEGKRSFEGRTAPLEISGRDRMVVWVSRDITEQKEAAEKLRRNEASLAEAQRIAHLGNWEWDISSGELRWSDEIYRIFGLAAQEFSATYEAFLNSVHPDDRESVKATLNKALAERAPYSIDHRVVLPDGTVRTVHEEAEVTIDEQGEPCRMTGTVQDITERKKIETAIRESEEFNREVLNSLDFNVAVLAKDGRIIAVNQEWTRFARENGGTPEKTGVGTNYLEVCRVEAPEAFDGLQAILTGTLEHFELEYPCHSPNEQRWFVMRVSPLGRERGGLIVAHLNITLRKRLEEELEKQNQDLESKVLARTEELEEKTIQAEAANRAKSQFLANMSHELKTPLHAIIGFSELLKDGAAGELTAQQNDYLMEVWESGRHLNRIISNILNMTQLVSNQVALELSEFPLKAAIEEILERFSAKAAREGIRTSIEIPADIVRIVADRAKIMQVVQDLVGNACKFMAGGGSLRVAVRRITIPEAGSLSSERQEIYAPLSSHHSGNFLEISVADTGIGIAKENLGRLFHPFQQLEPALTKQYEGVGLGLSICRKYVELHGGKIWVESELGKGSTFYLAIPELTIPQED